MLGHRLATGGPKPRSPQVRAWDNNGADGRWRVAELGQAPFNPVRSPAGDVANNLALHFAVLMAEHLDEDVYLVGHAVNGSTILTWEGEVAENLSRLITETNYALHSPELAERGIGSVDTMLWHQGESDEPEATMVPTRLLTLEDYRAAFDRMRAALARQHWWRRDTRFIAGELVRDGWLSARNDFWSTGGLNGPHDAVASSEGLAHTGDAAHFDGDALATLGRRMFDCWVRLS
jgi:hypothetical protein